MLKSLPKWSNFHGRGKMAQQRPRNAAPEFTDLHKNRYTGVTFFTFLLDKLVPGLSSDQHQIEMSVI